MFTKADCVTQKLNWEGLIVVLKPEVVEKDMLPVYRDKKFQLWKAFGGFGCRPDSLGRSVMAECLVDGEKVSWRREDFLGVIKPDILQSYIDNELSPMSEDIQKIATEAKQAKQLLIKLILKEAGCVVTE